MTKHRMRRAKCAKDWKVPFRMPSLLITLGYDADVRKESWRNQGWEGGNGTRLGVCFVGHREWEDQRYEWNTDQRTKVSVDIRGASRRLARDL